MVILVIWANCIGTHCGEYSNMFLFKATNSKKFFSQALLYDINFNSFTMLIIILAQCVWHLHFLASFQLALAKASSYQAEFFIFISVVSFHLVSRPHMVHHIFHSRVTQSYHFDSYVNVLQSRPPVAHRQSFTYSSLLHSPFVFSFHRRQTHRENVALSLLPPTGSSWPILVFGFVYSWAGKGISVINNPLKCQQSPRSQRDWHVGIRH